MVRYEEGEDARISFQHFVARIRFFHQSYSPPGLLGIAGEELEPFRLACAKLLPLERIKKCKSKISGDLGRHECGDSMCSASGILWKHKAPAVAWRSTLTDRMYEAYPVLLQHIQKKVLSAKDRNAPTEELFVQYNNLSGR